MLTRLGVLKNKNLLQLISVSLLGSVLFARSAEAKKTIEDAGTALESAVSPTGLPKGEVATYVGNVAQWLFGITGLIFFVLALYAGITWFLARGEDERITKARDTLITAIVGLMIATGAYAITVFITGAVGFGGQ